VSQDLPIAKAKARFAELVRRAERGETVILTRHGRPVARLAPIGPGDEPSAVAFEAAEGIREPVTPYGAERRDRRLLPASESRREALERLLQLSIWPRVPGEQLGAGIDKQERERILGYGRDGV